MTFLSVISGNGLISALVTLLVVGAVLGLFVWLVGKSPLPEPFKSILTWLLYLAGVLFLVNFLLGLIGKPFLTW